MSRTWTNVSEDLDDLRALLPEVVANARLFIAFANERYLVPDECGKGYLPTLSLSWVHLTVPLEIEIFPDQYELYRFFDGRTEIRAFSCDGKTVPFELSEVLDILLPRAN